MSGGKYDPHSTVERRFDVTTQNFQVTLVVKYWIDIFG